MIAAKYVIETTLVGFRLTAIDKSDHPVGEINMPGQDNLLAHLFRFIAARYATWRARAERQAP